MPTRSGWEGARWKRVWWAMSFSAVGTLGAGWARSAEQVRLTCVCRERAPPARLMEHMGSRALRHVSCHSQQASPLSCFPRGMWQPQATTHLLSTSPWSLRAGSELALAVLCVQC